MKILLDENITLQLNLDFGKHEVKSVKAMGWLGKQNGELLGLMAFHGFDVFITRDRNLRHQQNLSKFNITIFVLISKGDTPEFIQPLIEKVKKLLRKKIKTGVIEIT